MQNSTIPNCPSVNSTCLNYCYYGKDIEIANINTTEGCRCCSFPPVNILLAAKYFPFQYRNNTHGGQYPAIQGFAGGYPAKVGCKDRAGEGGKTHTKALELMKERLIRLMRKNSYKGPWELMKERLRREFTHSARND